MNNIQKETIFKIGGIILKDKKLLVVRKITPDNRSEFIMPGGRIEGNETPRETLERELKEELDVQVLQIKYFGSFDDTAVFENIPIHMEVYFVTIHGLLKPKTEIKEFIWIDREYGKDGIKLGSVLSSHIIPKLIQEKLM